jgi:hypothetical protein
VYRTVLYYTVVCCTILYSTVLYCTIICCIILYRTLCIVTLDSAGFLHKHATSSQLLHPVTLDTAGSYHKSNYLGCYCLTVSFKINKLFSGSARAHARTLTHTHTAVTTILYHTAGDAVALLLRSPAVIDIHDKISLRTLLVQTTYALPLLVPERHSVPHGPRPPEDEDIIFGCRVGNTPPPPPPRRSAVSPNTGLWVTAPL